MTSTSLDRGVIDEPLFSFRELLQLTGIGRGTAEGYMVRGIVVPMASGPQGKGYHRRYTGRDVLKFAAVAYMSKVGIAPDWVKHIVASEVLANFKTGQKEKGTLDSVIDDFILNGEQSIYASRSPLVFNAARFGPFPIENTMQSFGCAEGMATGLRTDEIVAYVVFDAWIFVRLGFDAIQGFLSQRAKE